MGLLGLLLLAGIGVWGVSTRAHAADFYLETLAPGADAGSTASSTALKPGVQFMLRCATYGVTYKLCETTATSCTATTNDSPIDADLSIDVCPLNDYSKLSVFRTYDGGVGSCRLYRVNPPSPQCKL